MHITSRSVRNRDAYALPFQCRAAVLSFRLGGIWNYTARNSSRTSPLRTVLLRHVHGRIDRGRVGDVGPETLDAIFGDRLLPAHKLNLARTL